MSANVHRRLAGVPFRAFTASWVAHDVQYAVKTSFQGGVVRQTELILPVSPALACYTKGLF
jgi:hypothetical protein